MTTEETFIKNKKIICIMPVWDEQNMIGLALASSKDFVDEYLIIIQKGVDKTKDVIEYCKCLWNLKITYLESELKLRYKRELMVNYAKSYADYYIIQDGDEIFREDAYNEIMILIRDGVTFSTAPIVFLENDLEHTTQNEENIIMINHPFFFKNLPDIYFPNTGDMPWYDPTKKHDIKTFSYPLKFDCKIKNYRRLFLREMFTPWHENSNETCSIEEYCDKHHYHVKWYRKNVNSNLSVEEIIKQCNVDYDIHKFKWNIIYDEQKYYKKPPIITYFIEKNKKMGIEKIEDLYLLNSIPKNKNLF